MDFHNGKAAINVKSHVSVSDLTDEQIKEIRDEHISEEDHPEDFTREWLEKKVQGDEDGFLQNLAAEQEIGYFQEWAYELFGKPYGLFKVEGRSGGWLEFPYLPSEEDWQHDCDKEGTGWQGKDLPKLEVATATIAKELGREVAEPPGLQDRFDWFEQKCKAGREGLPYQLAVLLALNDWPIEQQRKREQAEHARKVKAKEDGIDAMRYALSIAANAGIRLASAALATDKEASFFGRQKDWQEALSKGARVCAQAIAEGKRYET